MQEYTLHRVFGRNYDLSPASRRWEAAGGRRPLVPQSVQGFLPLDHCVSEEALGLNVPTALLAGADEVIQ